MRGLSPDEYDLLCLLTLPDVGREPTAQEEQIANHLIALGRASTYPCPCLCGYQVLNITPSGREAMRLHLAAVWAGGAR